ncbi:MAG: DUF4377 domain-containing protein, partial [Bacteroidota bacterium]
INLRVNYFTMECEGLFPTQCLQVQEGNDIGTTTWYNFFDSIENFAYEPVSTGLEITLRTPW